MFNHTCFTQLPFIHKDASHRPSNGPRNFTLPTSFTSEVKAFNWANALCGRWLAVLLPSYAKNVVQRVLWVSANESILTSE